MAARAARQAACWLSCAACAAAGLLCLVGLKDGDTDKDMEYM